MVSGGIPKESVKDAALIRSRKFTLRVNPRKQRPSLSRVVKSCVVKNGVSGLSWEHETPPVTDPLICDTV